LGKALFATLDCISFSLPVLQQRVQLTNYAQSSFGTRYKKGCSSVRYERRQVAKSCGFVTNWLSLQQKQKHSLVIRKNQP